MKLFQLILKYFIKIWYPVPFFFLRSYRLENIFLIFEEYNYPMFLVNFTKLVKLSPSSLLLGKFSKVVVLQRRTVSLAQQVDHPMEGDSIEKRHVRVFVRCSSSFSSLDQIPFLPSCLDGTNIISWLIRGGALRYRAICMLQPACFYWVKESACTREIYLEQTQSTALPVIGRPLTAQTEPFLTRL